MMPPLLSWAGAALVALLVIAAVTDLKFGRIYNVVTYPAVAVGLIGHTLTGGVHGDAQHIGLLGALAGLAVGYLPLLVANLMGGIGGGDAKVMGAIGAIMGWYFALVTLFYGLIAAVIMALAVMIRRRIFVATFRRLGRFLYLVLFTPGKPAGPTTEESPKIAFGLALCFGAAAAVVEALVTSAMPGRILGF